MGKFIPNPYIFLKQMDMEILEKNVLMYHQNKI